MAKKKTAKRRPARRDQNKSKAINDIFDVNPDAKAKDIVATLKQQGIIVSPNYVSVVKSKRIAKAGRAKPGANSRKSVSSPNELDAAIALARACKWDFGSARHFLTLVEQVHESLR